MSRSGIVLAGGEARRMGGADKAMVLHEGRPLIAWVVATLAPLCDEIVVARGARPPLEGLRCVPDEGGGPASGLRAACAAVRGEWIAVAPCDAPRLTSALYEELILHARGHDGACVVADGVTNALVGVYRREALSHALVGARSPREAIARMDVARVEAPARIVEDVDEDPSRREVSSGDGSVPRA